MEIWVNGSLSLQLISDRWSRSVPKGRNKINQCHMIQNKDLKKDSKENDQFIHCGKQNDYALKRFL